MIEVKLQSAELISALDRLSRRVSDMSPVMDSIGQELEKRISNRFETESDPDGKRWAAWKPSTVKSYPKNGNRRILDRGPQDRMLNSLSHNSDSHSVTVGFGKKYALYHEFGTKNMKRRGLIFADPVNRLLSSRDEEAVLSVVNDYLRQAAG